MTESNDREGEGPRHKDADRSWMRLAEIRILHLCAEAADRERFAEALDRSLVSRNFNLVLEQVGVLAEGIERLTREHYALVVAGLELPNGGGLAIPSALVKNLKGGRLVVYARECDAECVAAAMEQGADEVFDTAIFDPRVIDQILGQMIERTLTTTALIEVVHGRDPVLAHRREAERRMHRLMTTMLAIALEPLSLEVAVGKVIGLLVDSETTSELEAGVCFLYDSTEGACRLAAHRGLEMTDLPPMQGPVSEGCACMRPPDDTRTHFVHFDEGAQPSCQAVLGRHACYVSVLRDPDGSALGSLAFWTRPECPREEGLERLVENAARIVSSIVAQHDHANRVRRLQQVIEQSPLSVLLTDPEGRITYANSQVYETTGFGADEVLGNNPSIFASGLVSPETFQEMWSVLGEGGVWEGELINRKNSGDLFTEYAIISPVIDTDGRLDGYAAVKRDITEELRFKARLDHQATHDSLTDLANRGLLGDRVAQAINYAKRNDHLVAALLIDIDDFATLNDMHGHAAGDQVLLEIARRLKAQTREYDTVARLGNDEFIVIHGDVGDERNVLNLASRYLALFDEPFETEAGAFKITASMGVATYPHDGENGAELLRHATLALARQKDVGPGGVSLFGKEMEERLVERYELLSALRGSLDPVQFELHYQPQVDPVTGAIDGAEALLRWTLPDGRPVSPMKFIPLAESSGLIVPIGAWVIATACRQFAAWHRDIGVDFPVSVNVSSRQFREPGFIDAIRQALEESGLNPAMLVLELTESLLLDNPDGAREVMQEINALGVSLAIDDFGTGYSSLSYLTGLPLHQLKVDRAFVRDIEENPQDAIIASTIIAMAHNLGMEVVAEGAETDEQVLFLTNYRCNLIQGYHYSKPLPAAAFVELFRTPPWSVAARVPL